MLNLLPREDALRPRRGWYAYRVTGAASLPSWAVEIALAVERPVDLHPEGSPSHNDGVPGDPPSSRGFGAQHDEVLGDLPRSRGPGAQAQAIVLLKAPGRPNWLAGIVEAAAEVEAAAGVRPVTDADRSSESPLGARSRLLTVRRYLDWSLFLLPSCRHISERPGRGVSPLPCGAGDRRRERCRRRGRRARALS
jgi:hypothetical protein